MADDQRNANVVLTADTSQYETAMDRSAKSTNNALSAVMKLSTALTTLTTRAGKGLTVIGAGELAALTAAGVQAANLQSKMSQLSASAVMAGRDFGITSRQVNSLRRDFAVTSDQAVQLVT